VPEEILKKAENGYLNYLLKNQQLKQVHDVLPQIILQTPFDQQKERWKYWINYFI
jgi:hypothetical protein